MSLDRDDLTPCVACGRPVDGSVCDQYCEARSDEMLAEREREKMLKAIEAIQVLRAQRRAERRAQLANIIGDKA